MLNEKKIWRVGFVGTGQIAPFHLQALRRLESIEFVGVYDSDVSRAESFARQHAAGRAFATYERMLSQVDVVHVLTPPASHAALTLRALEAGCHVFVEKPLASTAEECDRIIDAAQKARRTVGVDHSLLYDPFTVSLLQAVRAGRIGRVLSVHCIRSQDYPEYCGGPLPAHAREASFPFADLGVHALYQIEALLGPIERMQWNMRHQGSDYQLTFDEWQTLVQCRDGNAQVTLSWSARPLQDLMLVMGTEGTIRLDRFGMSVTERRQVKMPEHPRRLWNATAEALQTLVQVPVNALRVVSNRLRRYHGIQEMVRAYYAALSAQRPAPVGPADTRRILDWMERVSADAEREKNRLVSARSQSTGAKTLVTGATGFIGSHLVQRLLEEGRAVRILSRRPPKQAWRDDPRLEVVLGDLGDPDAVDRAVEGMQVVYHVGGTVHGSANQFWRGSVLGTEHVIESALRHQVKQLIHVSSLSVLRAYPDTSQPMTEESPLEPYPERRGLYTQTKCLAEKKVAEAVQRRGLPAMIVRPAEVIGPGAPLLSSGVGQRRGQHLVMFGDGTLAVPLVHVTDLIDGLLACEASRITDGTIVHFVDESCVTQTEMVRAFSDLTGQALRVHHLPRWLLLTMAMGVSGLLACMGKSSPVSVYRFRSALAPRVFSHERATRLLGWQPVRGARQGLRDTILGESGGAVTAVPSDENRSDRDLCSRLVRNSATKEQGQWPVTLVGRG